MELAARLTRLKRARAESPPAQPQQPAVLAQGAATAPKARAPAPPPPPPSGAAAPPSPRPPGALATRVARANAAVAQQLSRLKRAVEWRAGGPAAAAADGVQSFARQADAFACADALALARADPATAPHKVFSLECGAGGTRRFLVAHPDALWRAQLACAPAARHFYEILREDTPCRLYFDVEFKLEPVAAVTRSGGSVSGSSGDGAPLVTNAGVDGDALTATLLHATAAALQRCYGVQLRGEHVVHLESSTPAKFSRHLILHLPPPPSPPPSPDEAAAAGDGAEPRLHAAQPVSCRPGEPLFRDVAHVGAFVADVVAGLQRQAARGDACAAALWVETLKGGVGAGGGRPPGDGGSAGASSLGRAEAGAAAAPPPGADARGGSGDGGGGLRREFVADLGVYTRNRAMRMYLSRKFGKPTPLLPAACNQFAAAAGALPGEPLTRAYWRAVCRVREEAPQPAAAQAAAGEPALPGAPAPQPLPQPARHVQVGSAAWERALWDASLITGHHQPLWLCARRQAAAPPQGAAAGPPPPAGTAPRDVLAAYQPASHPVTGARLLYAAGAPSPAVAAAAAAPNAALAEGSGVGAGAASPSAAALVTSGAALAAARRRPASPSAPLGGSGSSSAGGGGLGAPVRVIAGGAAPPPFAALAAWVCRVACGPLPPGGAGGGGGPAAAPAAAAATDAYVRGWSGGARELRVVFPPAAAAAAAAGVPETTTAVLGGAAAAAAAGTRAKEAAATAAAGSTATVLAWVTYELGGTRWCQRIGRQHRSNHVAWRVDLEAGRAWQTCWDADCRGWRSPPLDVPVAALPDQLPVGTRVLAARA